MKKHLFLSLSLLISASIIFGFDESAQAVSSSSGSPQATEQKQQVCNIATLQKMCEKAIIQNNVNYDVLPPIVRNKVKDEKNDQINQALNNCISWHTRELHGTAIIMKKEGYKTILNECPEEVIELFHNARSSWKKWQPYRIKQELIDRYINHPVHELLNDERLFRTKPLWRLYWDQDPGSYIFATAVCIYTAWSFFDFYKNRKTHRACD